MILTNHGKHLSDAFLGMREIYSEMIISTSKEGCTSNFNKNLLQLFSPFMREIFASIPQDSAPGLILPDQFSSLTMSHLEKLLLTGVSTVDSVSNKDINDLVEIGKLLRVDLSRISYGQNLPEDNSRVSVSNGVSMKPSGNDLKIKSSSDLQETLQELEYAEGTTNQTLKENVVKKEKNPEENLLSFCEGIKDLIGKSLGLETDEAEKPSLSMIKIKEEVIKEVNEVSEVYKFRKDDADNLDLLTSYQTSESPVFGIDTTSRDIYSEIAQNPFYLPVIAPGMIRPNSFTMETPPPDAYPGFPQNLNPTVSPHQPLPRIPSRFPEYQDRGNNSWNNSRLDRVEQSGPPAKKKQRQAFACRRCGDYETPHYDHLQRHLTECKILNLKCKICDYTAKKSSGFYSHLRVMHTQLVVACEHCKYTTFYKNQMKRHKLECPNVSFGSVRSQNVEINSKRSETGVVSCIKCEYVGPHERALQQHISMKHESSKRKDRRLQDKPGNKSEHAWREGKGWGPDDHFTCDFWNFKACSKQSGHESGVGVSKVARFHVCSLCYRNLGEKEFHPATRCNLFPLPVEVQKAGYEEDRDASALVHHEEDIIREPLRESSSLIKEDGEVDSD